MRASGGRLNRSSLSCVEILVRAATPALLLAIAACAPTPPDEIEQRDGHLIGGVAATDAQYPATVKLAGCTATKVGPKRYLIAAHCVTIGSVPKHQPGARLILSSKHRGVEWRDLTLDRLDIHPAWLAAPEGYDQPIITPGAPPDLAIVRVHETRTDIATATVVTSPVAPGTPVVLSGFGCIDRYINGQSSDGLRIGSSVVAPFSAIHLGLNFGSPPPG